MITKFKITRAPLRASVNILGGPYVLNQEYNILNQDTMNIVVSDRSVPYDNFGFKLGNDNGDWSPEYKCTINAQSDVGVPTSSNFLLDITLYETIDITSNFVIDNNTDRIMFTDRNPKHGVLSINGNELVINKDYFLYEFKNVIYTSTDVLSSQHSTTIFSFKVGNKNGYNATIYTATLRATSNLSGGIISGSTNGAIL